MRWAESKTVQFEDGSQPGISYTEEQSAGTDTAWLKQGKKPHFAYRSYLVTHTQYDYVREAHTAPASQSERMRFEAIIGGAHQVESGVGT
ncbi:hypothetical protein [Nitrosomonas communis]|uniref:Transposase, IS5 family n=1 Tax=Nitrosomonas communis TaxID=44574 RepID=A0A1I4NSA0_9PROT|nr:hypothetical protein [Nitrosomonas communis]SFM18404.1 transposase, IS5 family [Nitrosomonas communis]